MKNFKILILLLSFYFLLLTPLFAQTEWIYPTDSIFWVTKASAPGGRYWCPGVGIVRDTIYLLGGRGNGGYANSVRSMYAYLPLNDTWITNLPTLLTTRRAGGGGQVGNKIYVCGGRDSTHATLNTCEEFDVDTKIVTQKVSMPSGRWACAGSAIDDKVYIFGSENESDELFEYNTTADSWRIITPTYRPQGRGWNSVASAGSKLYICGGGQGSNVFNDCWKFDPITELWTQKADMPGPRIYHTAIGFDDDIFVVGGASSSAGSGDSIVYRYKISSNSWLTETPIPTPRGSSMLAIHDDWLYVMCGAGPLSPSGINEAARIYPPGIEEDSMLDTDHLTPEIYPNPAKGVVRVSCPLSVKEIKIFNVSGKLVREIASPPKADRNDRIGEMEISLKGINPGIYFLRFGKETKKFLVMK
jgi:N-acetylneuraminic acid mutarotase